MQLFGGLEGRIEKLEAENAHLFNVTNILAKRLAELEKAMDGQPMTVSAPVKAAAPPAKKEESDDDDFKFSDDEEEKAAPKETEMQRMKRLAAEKKAEAEAKEKSKKKVVVLKSNVILDVKPWDDETDMKELEAAVRGVKMEGLVWGNSKLVEIGFGIKKLQISSCIVDDLVGLYDLEDNIMALEDYVQSVDIAAHNKI